MKRLQEPDRPRPGLRERKKARTRAAIQEQALRLFGEQGYDETTVEQIADAAEVSPSTFFRYFSTKEDVVLYDALDPILLAAFEAQPANLSPITALRATMRSVLGGAAGVRAQQDERAALIISVPELRMRMLDEMTRTMLLLAEAVARRAGKNAQDPAVRALVGAVIGVGIAALFNARGGMASDYLTLMDNGLAELEAGFPALRRP